MELTFIVCLVLMIIAMLAAHNEKKQILWRALNGVPTSPVLFHTLVWLTGTLAAINIGVLFAIAWRSPWW